MLAGNRQTASSIQMLHFIYSFRFHFIVLSFKVSEIFTSFRAQSNTVNNHTLSLLEVERLNIRQMVTLSTKLQTSFHVVPETKLHKQKFFRTLSYKQRHKYSLHYFPDAENNVCSAFFGHQFSGQRRICTLLAEEVSDYEQVPRRLAVEDTNEYPVTQRKSLGKVPGHWAETAMAQC